MRGKNFPHIPANRVGALHRHQGFACAGILTRSLRSRSGLRLPVPPLTPLPADCSKPSLFECMAGQGVGAARSP